MWKQGVQTSTYEQTNQQTNRRTHKQIIHCILIRISTTKRYILYDIRMLPTDRYILNDIMIPPKKLTTFWYDHFHIKQLHTLGYSDSTNNCYILFDFRISTNNRYILCDIMIKQKKLQDIRISPKDCYILDDIMGVCVWRMV